jgi:hypothetical protein
MFEDPVSRWQDTREHVKYTMLSIVESQHSFMSNHFTPAYPWLLHVGT